MERHARPPARRAGRPTAAARETRDHREALIDAARLAFASHGFAATSLRQVATAAKVTPALASYYFRDKAGLLEAVIDSRVVPLVQALAGAVNAAGGEPKAAIGAFVRRYTAIAAANPWLPQLIVREVLNAEGALRESFPQRFAGGIVAMLRGLVDAGKQRGDFRRDLATPEVVMTLFSLCIFPFIATPLVNDTLAIDTSPARADALAEHHLAILFAGISEPPCTDSAPNSSP